MRQIKKIAVICYCTSGGGAERATCMWVQNMLKLGKTILWLYSAETVGSRKIDHPDLKYQYLPFDQNRQSILGDILVKEKIDFCYDINPDDVLLLDDIKTIKDCGCLAGVADHSCYFYPLYTRRPQVYLKRSQALKKADIVTALSPENVKWFLADGVKHVVCMPNFLTFTPSSKDNSRAGVRDKELLFVGRLCEIKSPERALRVVAELKKKQCFEDIHLRLLGRFDNPVIETQLKNLVEKLSIQNNVSFEGEVLDVEHYFKESKLLIMTSYLEGAPMVINEAKAHAMPTVMFSLDYVPGTKEREGVISVPQDDIEAMSNAILRCINDKTLYERLSQSALNSLKELSNNNIVEKWLDLFDKMERGIVISPQSTDVDKTLVTTMELFRLVLQRISIPTTISTEDYARIVKKNTKHLKALRVMIYVCSAMLIILTLLLLKIL